MKLSDRTQAILGTLAGILIGIGAVSVSVACDAAESTACEIPETINPAVIEAAETPERTFVDVCERPAVISGYYGNAYPWEYDLMCRVVELEAGGESEECRAAVTAVICNRLASGIWGISLSEVLTADQFETVPYADTAVVQESTADVVAEVWQNGSAVPADVLFFRDTHYHTFYGAVDKFAVGAMYFSGSIWCEVEP